MAEPRPKGNRPDWELRYLNKDTDEKGQVGVGWNNEDGSIRVRLNTRVTLCAGPECILTLFKFRDYQGIPAGTKRGDAFPKDYKPTQSEIDERPF
jgi:hypothetical protein